MTSTGDAGGLADNDHSHVTTGQLPELIRATRPTWSACSGPIGSSASLIKSFHHHKSLPSPLPEIDAATNWLTAYLRVPDTAKLVSL